MGRGKICLPVILDILSISVNKTDQIAGSKVGSSSPVWDDLNTVRMMKMPSIFMDKDSRLNACEIMRESANRPTSMMIHEVHAEVPNAQNLSSIADETAQDPANDKVAFGHSTDISNKSVGPHEIAEVEAPMLKKTLEIQSSAPKEETLVNKSVNVLESGRTDNSIPLNSQVDLKNLVNPSAVMKEMREDMRRSDRLQKGVYLTTEDNMAKMGRKRNIEGNKSPSTDSFSILDDEVIISRASKMGAPINVEDFSTINMLRDIEKARIVLILKHQESLKQVCDTNNNISIANMDPKNDIELICGAQEEESDMDNFILVTPKRKRKSVKKLNILAPRKPKARGKEIPCKKGGGRKQGIPKPSLPKKTKRKVNHERTHLELQRHQEKMCLFLSN